MTISDTGGPVGQTAAGEVKSALVGLMTDLTAFRTEISEHLQAQDERLTMLDRKTAFATRPALSTAAETDLTHKHAFSTYLRNGDDSALRGLELEGKNLTTVASDGAGLLVDPQTADTIRNVVESTASVRAIATVVNVEATSFDVLVDHGDIGTGWSTEDTVNTDAEEPQVVRISIPLHELSALPKASQRLLDDAAFDIETWLAGRIADKFVRAEAEAFIKGDGQDKPKGFLDHPQIDEGQNDWAWGSIGYIKTGVDNDFASANAADAIVELIYSLNAPYRANASFVMNSKTAGAVRKMKDADGRFVWADGGSSEPARLLGYPVLIAEEMPNVDDAAPDAIAFGDFAAGYTIAERPDLRVLRDPFSAKPHVLFYATKRVGGDVSDFAAIKLLKFSA